MAVLAIFPLIPEPFRALMWPNGLISPGLELSGGWIGGGRLNPPVHVYRRSILSENRPETSIPGQNFKHFGS